MMHDRLDHLSVVWGNCNKGLSEKLQRLQNRTARILMSASHDSNLDDLFLELIISREGFCIAELSCGTIYL